MKIFFAIMTAAAIAGISLYGYSGQYKNKQKEIKKMNMVQDPNDFTGSDIEKINGAIAASAKNGRTVRISARRPDAVSDRDYWLIDSAILVPENTTLYLDNCRIKLSDRSRDNWIRSANCGLNCKEVKPLSNIHIIGSGNTVLEGADIPRSTGDSGKVLGERTFGSDTGKDGEVQKGDWRNIGILLVKVDRFTISGIRLVNSHCWAVSLEYCTNGKVRDLDFASTGRRIIQGEEKVTMNQDGLDLRRGCRNIIIENITGYTGDDLIALTALGSRVREAGLPGTTEMCGGHGLPGTEEDTTSHIIIRNVNGYCAGGHGIVRFLNSRGVKLHHIQLDNLTDASPEGSLRAYAVVRIGDGNPAYGGTTSIGGTYGFQISHIQCRAKAGIMISGSLSESTITDVLNWNPETEGVVFASGKEFVRNVTIENVRTFPGK